ncbi:TPA: toprim domain-containing protein [Yersinia enterocolitica]|nr:toprim domain-containing protein [Yersinia enterocolitica]HEC4986909.1 toprim domain-containing protein [Yersinia enterocolitica]HEN3337220.1 toprim domain-containing protein [Yersinia enterocolitica]
MSKLSREMKILAKQAGGSHKTVHDRIRIMDRFSRHLLALNIQVRDVTGALLINPRGEKRLLPGSRIKSSFIPITHHALSQTIIITEGFATSLVISRFVAATVVAAISVINLTHVAVALRGRYPDAQIILAADNDVTDSDHNPGKQLAELAALAVNGLVTLPPTGDKADWDDYRQQVGTDTARIEFSGVWLLPSLCGWSLLKVSRVLSPLFLAVLLSVP